MNQWLATLAVALAFALPACPLDPNYFVPSHRLAGIGLGRRELSSEVLAERIDAMTQSQTFSIMREPQAQPGARRIESSSLQRLFRDAERRSGFPASVLQAIAYLESWGVANAESPAGPRGIMQISEATGRRMGLRVVYATRHRVTKTRTAVRDRHGRLVYRTVKHRETYTVLVRDDRLRPERAIPAAALYLSRLEQHYGGRDWAIWAYHCGEGCVADFLAMAKDTREGRPPSVAEVFFGCDPGWNRELCAALHTQMDRDYSPTYWFRVMRAQQLLQMYETEPAEFRDLIADYKYASSPSLRAPDRLSVWLKPQDLTYSTSERIHDDSENKLFKAPDDPEFFGYRLDALTLGMDGNNWRTLALPSTIGALVYIAFETRLLFAAVLPDVPFVPLDVTALVLPKGEPGAFGLGDGSRWTEHSSGQVFDLSLADLPGGERECLRFILDDLGWNGDLGFIDQPEGKEAVHIGCSPTSRGFFTQIFAEALAAQRERLVPATATPVAP